MALIGTYYTNLKIGCFQRMEMLLKQKVSSIVV